MWPIRRNGFTNITRVVDWVVHKILFIFIQMHLKLILLVVTASCLAFTAEAGRGRSRGGGRGQFGAQLSGTECTGLPRLCDVSPEDVSSEEDSSDSDEGDSSSSDEESANSQSSRPPRCGDGFCNGTQILVTAEGLAGVNLTFCRNSNGTDMFNFTRFEVSMLQSFKTISTFTCALWLEDIERKRSLCRRRFASAVARKTASSTALKSLSRSPMARKASTFRNASPMTEATRSSQNFQGFARAEEADARGDTESLTFSSSYPMFGNIHLFKQFNSCR